MPLEAIKGNAASGDLHYDGSAHEPWELGSVVAALHTNTSIRRIVLTGLPLGQVRGSGRLG